MLHEVPNRHHSIHMKWASTAAIAFAILFCVGCSKQEETIEDRFVFRTTYDMWAIYTALLAGDKKGEAMDREILGQTLVYQFMFLAEEEPHLQDKKQIAAVSKVCRRVALLLKLGLCKEVNLEDRIYYAAKGKKETLRQQVEKQIQRIPADELKEMTEKMTKLWTK